MRISSLVGCLALGAACSTAACSTAESAVNGDPTVGGNSAGGGSSAGSAGAGSGGNAGNSSGANAGNSSGGSAGSVGGAPLTPVCDGCPVVGTLNDAGQKLVFSDEFEGSALDRAVWGPELGMVRNREQQCYLERPENVEVRDGHLRLTALADAPTLAGCERSWASGEPKVQAKYSSASFNTHTRAAFRYGRIEARLKVPTARGTWPAFWMMPEDAVYGGWPKSGEIDIMEHVSQEPNTIHGTVHFEAFGQHQSATDQLELPSPAAEDFHEYRIDWTETELRWFVDGEQYFRYGTSNPISGRRPFAERFYLMFNLAVGGHWPEAPDAAEYPATLEVDWVRVWQ